MRETKRNDALIIADERGYAVHDDGKVFDVDGNFVLTHPDNNGYLIFQISDAGIRYDVAVHRLAALQRFGSIVLEEKVEVRHLNGNKRDNSTKNISFGSRVENINDISPVDRMHMSMMGTEKQRKLSFDQVRELRRLKSEGWSLRQLCKKYGLAVSTVSYIVNRKTYADV